MTASAADLRAQVVKVLNGAQKPGVEADRHDEHQFGASCFVCRGDVEKLADAVLPLLSEARADRETALRRRDRYRHEQDLVYDQLRKLVPDGWTEGAPTLRQLLDAVDHCVEGGKASTDEVERLRAEVNRLGRALVDSNTETERAADEVVQLRAEVERLTAGADPAPAEPGVVLSPGQWIARWNAATAEERLEQVRHLQDMADRADRCFLLDHEGRLGEEIPMLRQEIERLRAKLERVDWSTSTPGGSESVAMEALRLHQHRTRVDDDTETEETPC